MSVLPLLLYHVTGLASPAEASHAAAPRRTRTGDGRRVDSPQRPARQGSGHAGGWPPRRAALPPRAAPQRPSPPLPQSAGASLRRRRAAARPGARPTGRCPPSFPLTRSRHAHESIARQATQTARSHRPRTRKTTGERGGRAGYLRLGRSAVRARDERAGRRQLGRRAREGRTVRPPAAWPELPARGASEGRTGRPTAWPALPIRRAREGRTG
jgi:hypothetical protein